MADMMLSQEEIDALLNGGSSSAGSADDFDVELLTAEEKDALGEIGNISMGTAATTLFTLLNQKVTITTPKVSETTFSKLVKEFNHPCVTINIQYKIGVEGLNLLIINEKDVKIITDLMMGGDGSNVSDELTDLHLSAIGEAMNQMIGSASTSLSEMINRKVDISPPEAIYDLLGNISEDVIGIAPEENIVKIAFRMTVGDLIDSEIMQILTVSFAKQLVESILNPKGRVEEKPVKPAPVAQPAPQATAPQQPAPQPQAPPMGYEMPAQDPMYQSPPNYQQVAPRQPVNAQPIQFQSFDANAGYMGITSDISLIKDVPLEISVELGRTHKKISEILEFSQGSVIELDKLVGESLDILANGKKIAKGEVVVVDENYGIRITEIIVPEKRLNNL